MSQDLSRYQDWSTVPALPGDRKAVRTWHPGVLIDLTGDGEPSMEIDLTDAMVEVLGVESDDAAPADAADDATYVTVHRDDWERMNQAARALLAVRAAAKVDAGVLALGRHVDRRG